MQGGLTARSHIVDTGFRVWLSSPGQPPAFALLSGAAAQYASGGTPPIPQSAFADSSLCTRAPSLPEWTQQAFVQLPSAAAAGWPSRHGTNRLFCGTGLGLQSGPYRCWLASAGAIRQTAHPHRRQERVQRHAGTGPGGHPGSGTDGTRHRRRGAPGRPGG